MDNLFHYQGNQGKPGHLQTIINNDKNIQFYSEEEYDSSKVNTPELKQQKPKMSNFSNVGYTTDNDSEGGTPNNSKKNTNPCSHSYEFINTLLTIATKMSKFRNLVNTKQIEGDVENEPDFDESDIKKPGQEEKKYQDEDDAYNIQDQERRIKEKIKENPVHKLSKIKNTLPQNQVVNSDIEAKKTKQIKDDKFLNHPFRHLIFGPTISETTFKKYMILTQRGLVYAKKCLKGPSDKFIKSKQVILGESINGKKEKTLVLDLDETLIHSCPSRENPQVYVTATGDFGEEAKIGINVRPYCSLFLQKLSVYYTIYIYTASSSAYANAIIAYLDPKKQYISGVLTRNNCMETKNGFFIKDLRIIANKQLKDILIVDNLAHSFGFQIENGIPILEYHNDQKDCELQYLTDYLIEAAGHDDLREFNKKLKLEKLVDYVLDI